MGPNPYAPRDTEESRVDLEPDEGVRESLKRLEGDVNTLATVMLVLVAVTFLAIMTNPTWRASLTPNAKVQLQMLWNWLKSLFAGVCA